LALGKGIRLAEVRISGRAERGEEEERKKKRRARDSLVSGMELDVDEADRA